MAETETGMVTGAGAVSLLMLGAPAELARLAREGWFKPAGPDRWRLVDLVQGYIRHLQAAAKVATTKQLASAFSITATRGLRVRGVVWMNFGFRCAPTASRSTRGRSGSDAEGTQYRPRI
jgi:hypothetical protein